MQDATRVIGYRHHRSHQAWFHYGTRRAPAHTAMVWNTLLTVLFVSGVAICPQPGAAQPLIELMNVAIDGQSAEGNSNTPHAERQRQCRRLFVECLQSGLASRTGPAKRRVRPGAE